MAMSGQRYPITDIDILNLTRRLIDVGQDVIIYTEDCGTSRGMWMSDADLHEKLERRRTMRARNDAPGLRELGNGVVTSEDLLGDVPRG